MKIMRFLILVILVAVSFMPSIARAQVHPDKVVFVNPPPMVEIGLQIFLETDELALGWDMYHTGYYLNMCGYYHSGYNKEGDFEPVIFQAVCRDYRGVYWHLAFDAMGNFLFAFEGGMVEPD
jgi:hypothetical protein